MDGVKASIRLMLVEEAEAEAIGDREVVLRVTEVIHMVDMDKEEVMGIKMGIIVDRVMVVMESVLAEEDMVVRLEGAVILMGGDMAARLLERTITLGQEILITRTERTHMVDMAVGLRITTRDRHIGVQLNIITMADMEAKAKAKDMGVEVAMVATEVVVMVVPAEEVGTTHTTVMAVGEDTPADTPHMITRTEVGIVGMEMHMEPHPLVGRVVDPPKTASLQC